MKFLTQGHIIRYCIIGVTLTSLLGGFLIYACTSASDRLYLALFFCAFDLALLYSILILISFVEFSEKGIVEKRPFKKTVFISWSQCADILIYFYYEGHRNILFSEEILPDGEFLPISQLRELRKEGRLILVNFSDKIWEELLKYVPVERVRNAHLSEKHSYFYYLRYACRSAFNKK